MRLIPSNCYARWRVCSQHRDALEESAQEPQPQESLLQRVWFFQRLRRDQLVTLDGRTVRVLHPGFWNHAPGPDFQSAVIQFDNQRALSGDIEIDLQTQNWKTHRHGQNPAYRKVILHVVWSASPEAATFKATLPLKPYLDAPLADLKLWLESQPEPHFALRVCGRCCAPLGDLPEATVLEIIRQAAITRLQMKAAHCESRARQVGWENSLWEGLLGALGYKHNYWPMRRIAELFPLLPQSPDGRCPILSVQAWLFGISGLLPDQLDSIPKCPRRYLREIWDLWWRDREQFSDQILPRSLWCMSGMRPANHPLRRLALASHWLAAGDLMARLGQWFVQPISKEDLLPSLLDLLQTTQDGFWSTHWTLRSAKFEQPQPLLGPHRATDIAVNILLPWFWARSLSGKNEEAQLTAERRYFQWPPSEDNAVLRQARARLFGDRSTPKLGTAAQQQGLLQIVRDFCDQSNALCENCRFPGLVKQFG